MNNFKSGFIAVVGRTNVGKSTLLNAIIGQKLSIVSDKPQTTRNNIRLIHTTDEYQMIFIDTPGFHKPKSKLSSFMVQSASSSVNEVDLVILIVEEDEKIGKGDKLLLDKLAGIDIPVILVINKVDKIVREEVLKKIAMFSEYSFIKDIVPLSALKSENIDTLLNVIEKYMPEGPMYFPDDVVTDRAEKFFVGEIVREKALRILKQEIPHGIAVEVSKMTERKSADGRDIMDIDVTIYCERKTHKAIIIGKNGIMLKRIGTMSRVNMEEMLDIKVNLKIWVKVRDEWRDKAYDLRDLGYTENKE